MQQEGLLSIPMQAGGQPAVAVLNTGILPVGMSRPLAQALGLTIEPVPASNLLWSALPAITGQVSNVPVTMFGQDTSIAQMYVLDHPARFVYLSALMFSDFTMQLNMPQSRLCFLNHGAIDLNAAKNIEMRMSNGRVAVQVTINQQKPVWLELQLEYPGAIRLNREAAIDMELLEKDSTAESGVADSLMFGPYELGNIAVAIPQADMDAGSELQRLQRMARRGGGGGVNTVGALGTDILKHFVVTLDTQDERMHVYVPQ